MNHVLVQMNESYMTQYLEEKKLSQDQEVSGTTRTEEEELLVASKKIQCQVFENQGKENISWENASLTELNSKQCTWKWIKDDRNKWGGVFNVTLHETEPCRNGSHLDQEHHENVLLAVTCTTCAIRPCISMPFEKKKPDVTFAIPFIVKNKTHATGTLIIKQTKAITTNTKTTTIILIVSISSLLVVLTLVAFYYCSKRKRNKG